MAEIIIVSIFAFGAGFVDAIVGGGGLIQLPSLLIALPQAPIPTLFGTNKLSAIAGNSISAWQYSRRVKVPWKLVLISAIGAGIASFCGAKCTGLLQPSLLRPLVIILLIAVSLYTWQNKDLGTSARSKLPPDRELVIGLLLSSAIGFYDGFFGPGTGTFLVFAWIGILGYDFLNATAIAKIINWSTNFTAIVAFFVTGNILYQFALPMAICNILGAILGTRLAILKGNQFIRIIFQSVVICSIGKLSYDLIKSQL
jgi:uncharacterized protein